MVLCIPASRLGAEFAFAERGEGWGRAEHPAPGRPPLGSGALRRGREAAVPGEVLRTHPRREQPSGFQGCSKGEASASEENNLGF